MYGKSISIDLHNCDASLFTRKHLKRFVKELCNYIDMIPSKRVWWDYKWHPVAKRNAPPHLKGISLVQFIQTSTIVIHTLDDLRAVYIDMFSCKDFSPTKVLEFCEVWFNGTCLNKQSMVRK